MPKIFAIGLVSSTNPNQCSVPTNESNFYFRARVLVVDMFLKP